MSASEDVVQCRRMGGLLVTMDYCINQALRSPGAQVDTDLREQLNSIKKLAGNCLLVVDRIAVNIDERDRARDIAA